MNESISTLDAMTMTYHPFSLMDVLINKQMNRMDYAYSLMLTT